MSEDRQKYLRQGNRTVIFAVGYVLYCSIVVIAADNGAIARQGAAVGLCCAPALTLYLMYVLFSFIRDINSFRRDGWDFRKQQTRILFYPGENSPGPDDEPFSAKTSMFVVYPLFIVLFGLFAAIFWSLAIGGWPSN